MPPCAFEVARRQEQPSQRNEHISSPTSRPTSSEVGEASGQGWSNLSRVQRCGCDLTMHLQRTQSEVMGKRVTVYNKFRALFNRNPTHGLVSFRYDDRKVLRPQEGWHSGFNFVEAFFEPDCGLREARERIGLPSQGNPGQYTNSQENM